MTATLPAPTSLVDKDALRARFDEVRSHTETLAGPLSPEDQTVQSMPDVSPTKWHRAHVTWFFEEMILSKYVDGYERFDPQFAFLFNSYYNSVGTRTARDHRGDLSRPTVKKVFEFRRYVDEKMTELLSRSDLDPAIKELAILGINHELQHQELLITDLKYTFSVNPLFPVYREGYFPEEEKPQSTGEFVRFDAGKYDIGFEGDGFSFDNEHSRHRVWLDEFEISGDLVTNAEYLEFIESGAYTDHRRWHSEGWDWIHNENVSAPLYWHNIEGEWKYFTLGGLKNIDLSAPVCHVSYYEAAAFAEWKGMRLPTEFEWEAANDKFRWGKRWEWTNSAYLPYPGFAKAEGAVGEYNGKFMISQMVLRGASAVTPEGHSRATYRNFFHPSLRWQFTGIRLAR